MTLPSSLRRPLTLHSVGNIDWKTTPPDTLQDVKPVDKGLSPDSCSTLVVRSEDVINWKDVPTGAVIDVCEMEVRRTVPKSPYNAAAFKRYLRSHPDRQFATKVVKQIIEGCSLNYVGPRDVFINSPDCAADDCLALREEMLEGVVRGWYLGPFSRPPFPNSWCSDQTRCIPRFRIPKSKWTPNDGKKRDISHYSFESDGIPSVNEATIRDTPSMEYFQTQGIANGILRAGMGCSTFAWDVPHAYPTLKTKPDDWSQCCVRLGNEFFISMVNDFGAVQSGDDWSRMSLAIQYIISTTAAPEPDFYVDNFYHFFSNKVPGHEANRLVAVIKSVTDELGVSRHEEQFGTKFEALGWRWDTEAMCVELKPERRDLVLQILSEVPVGRFTLGKLNSLIGVLFHLSRVLPEGRAFLGRCIASQTAARRAGRRKTSSITVEHLMLDVTFWTKVVPTIPARRLLFEADWAGGEDVRVYTDASGWGYGAVNITTCEYVFGPWPDDILEAAKRSFAVSMPWLETLAVVMAARAWASRWAGQRVRMLVDCKPAVLAINRNYSSNKEMLRLLRNLNAVSIAQTFVVRADRVAGIFNTLADPLSRNNIQEFHDACSVPFSMVTRPFSAILDF